MAIIRIFHDGAGKVLGTEHRVDETYDDDNRPLGHTDQAWITTQDTDLFDLDGVVPFEALRVAGGRLAPDPTEVTRLRRKAKDRTVGGGGRIDELKAKLEADTITDAELKELLRLRLANE